MFLLDPLSELLVRVLLIDTDNCSLHSLDVLLNLALLDLFLFELKVTLALLLGLWPSESHVKWYGILFLGLRQLELRWLATLGVVAN